MSEPNNTPRSLRDLDASPPDDVPPEYVGDGYDPNTLLADLAADPDRVEELPRDELPGVLGEVEEIRARIILRLNTPPDPNGGDPTGEPDLILAGDVAEILEVSRDRVYELARQDRIPNVRIGRSVRFCRQEILTWIENGGQDLPGGWREDPER